MAKEGMSFVYIVEFIFCYIVLAIVLSSKKAISAVLEIKFLLPIFTTSIALW